MENILYSDNFCRIIETEDKAFYCDISMDYKELSIQKARYITKRILQAITEHNIKAFEFYYSRI